MRILTFNDLNLKWINISMFGTDHSFLITASAWMSHITEYPTTHLGCWAQLKEGLLCFVVSVQQRQHGDGQHRCECKKKKFLCWCHGRWVRSAPKHHSLLLYLHHAQLPSFHFLQVLGAGVWHIHFTAPAILIMNIHILFHIGQINDFAQSNPCKALRRDRHITLPKVGYLAFSYMIIRLRLSAWKCNLAFIEGVDKWCKFGFRSISSSVSMLLKWCWLTFEKYAAKSAASCKSSLVGVCPGGTRSSSCIMQTFDEVVLENTRRKRYLVTRIHNWFIPDSSEIDS